MKWVSPSDLHRMMTGLSLVAGLAAVIIVISMVVSFACRVPDPTSDPAYLTLKSQLRDEPANDEIKEQIRSLDQALRADYFRRRHFTHVGSWFLLVCVVIAVGSAKSASTIKRRLPEPSASTIVTDDPDAKMSLQSLTAVGGLAAGVFVVGTMMAVTHQSVIPANASELAALFPDESVEEIAGNPAASSDEILEEPEVAPLPTLELPSKEELALNWPRFRGYRGDGVATLRTELPNFNAADDQGIRWKTAIPLPGKNSLIRWETKLFLSGADEEKKQVYCLDSQSGELLWTYELPVVESTLGPPRVNDDTGYAASTMATNGVHVFAVFATGDLVALDLDGNQLWSKQFGPLENPYGHASSLVTHDDHLIVQLDHGSKADKLSKLVAMDASSGEVVWSVTREVPSSWSTPLIVDHEGQSQIVTCADPWVITYAANSGEELWRSKSMRQDVGPSPIAEGDVVYVANEYPGASAIRLGGQGEVTDTNVLWTVDLSIPDTASPTLLGDLILMMTSYGTLACYDKNEGGDPLWEEDFADDFQASPSRIGDNVLLVGQSGKCWLIHPTAEECQILQEHDLGEECVTCPAFDSANMYIRGEEHVIAIGAL